MARQYSGLTPVEAFFLKLTRIGLYGQCEDNDIFQEPIDWEELLQLSARLKMVAVVYDGVVVAEQQQKVSEDYAMQEETQLKFVGYQLMYQQRYHQYMGFLSQLVGFYDSIHIPVMVLKGIGLSQSWLNPSSRPTGDIDVYLFGHQEEADRCVHERIGVDIRYYPVGHHTAFHVDGETVENHFSFLSVPVISKKMRRLESDMLSLASDYSQISVGKTVCRIPSATFNAIYLVAHLSTHFLSDNISLRQLCDWTMFVRSHHDKVNWNQVTMTYQRYGLEQFAGTLNHIAIAYLGMDASCVPVYMWDEKAASRILKGVFMCYPEDERPQETILKKIVSNVKKGISDKWKYRLLGVSMVGTTIRKGFYFLLHPKDFYEHQLF